MKPALTAAQAKTKDAYLRRNYGITLQEFNAIRHYQDYKCAMCRQDEIDFKSNLAVDHDHITGQIRGLLCWICNKRLGKFSDNHKLLLAAAQYVSYLPAVAAGVLVYTAPGRIGTKVRSKALDKLNGITKPKRRSPRGKAAGSRRSRKRPAKG